MSKEKFILTKDNYHSSKANAHFLNVSTAKAITECEAKAVAVIDNRWDELDKDAYVKGGYFHACFEGVEELEEFKEKNLQVFDARKKTEKVLKTDYKKINTIVADLKEDKLFMYAISGEKEQIMIGLIEGIPFKIRVDAINHEDKYFTDLKFMKSIREKFWSNEEKRRVNFIEHYDYLLQVAVYQEIVRQNTGILYSPMILAVSKDGLQKNKYSDRELIGFDQDSLTKRLAEFKKSIKRIVLVWNGVAENVEACGVCEYCKSVKKIKAPKNWMEI